MQRELTTTPVDITTGIPALAAGKSYLIEAAFDAGRVDAYLHYLVRPTGAFPNPAPTRVAKLQAGQRLSVTVVSGQSVWLWNPFHATQPAGIAINEST